MCHTFSAFLLGFWTFSVLGMLKTCFLFYVWIPRRWTAESLVNPSKFVGHQKMNQIFQGLTSLEKSAFGDSINASIGFMRGKLPCRNYAFSFSWRLVYLHTVAELRHQATIHTWIMDDHAISSKHLISLCQSGLERCTTDQGYLVNTWCLWLWLPQPISSRHGSRPKADLRR